MTPERKKGLTFSVSMHLLLLLIAIFGLPSLMSPPPEEIPIEITLLPVPVTDKTNLPTSEKMPTPTVKPIEKPKPPEPEKPVEKPEPPKPAPPSPPVKTEQPPPPPPPPEKPIEQPKPVEKKPEPKKPEEKKKAVASEEDLDAVLKSVQKEAKNQQKPDKPVTKPKPAQSSSSTQSRSSHFDPSAMMSMDERAAIMSQISQCWNPPAGVKDAHGMVVIVDAEYNSDGSYTKVALSRDSAARASSDSTYRSAADAALRAVKMCSPLKNLPAEKYNGWREMELTFDPKNLL